MKEKNKDYKILCNDCKEVYIDEKRFNKYGICLACQRRKTMSNTHHIKYVPFKELPIEEKERLRKQRKINNRWSKQRNAKRKVEDKSTEIRSLKSKVTKEKEKTRKNQIYTQEIIEYIKSIANENMSVSKLKEMVLAKYPDLNITTTNLNNVVNRNNIPHYTKPRGKLKNEEEHIIINPTKTNQITDYIDNTDDIDNTADSSQIEIESDNVSVRVDADGDPIRLKPIKQEVVSLLDDKFKEKKCKNKYNYTIDDYINMLEMFEYLVSNIDGLIRCRDLQFNIVNNYQFDIVHEMENELADEGNTYLQDKMYVMRDYRRYMEIDYKALKLLRPVLKLIRGMIHPNNPNNLTDPKSINGCLRALKQLINENSQPKFIPRVDVDMTKKYDWAINKNSNYKKIASQSQVKYTNNQAEKTHNTTISLSKEQQEAGFGVYRVTCKISGGGYGVFRPWYKDYSCVKAEIAMAFAQQEFAKMKSENGQLLFSEVECHKLNVS